MPGGVDEPLRQADSLPPGVIIIIIISIIIILNSIILTLRRIRGAGAPRAGRQRTPRPRGQYFATKMNW